MVDSGPVVMARGWLVTKIMPWSRTGTVIATRTGAVGTMASLMAGVAVMLVILAEMAVATWTLPAVIARTLVVLAEMAVTAGAMAAGSA